MENINLEKFTIKLKNFFNDSIKIRFYMDFLKHHIQF